MKIKIEEIKVKKRARKKLEEIEELSESIKRYGLLNPIVVDQKNTLIAGERRLEAAKQLGWTQIDAKVVTIQDKAQALEIEIEENTQRKEFSEEELINAITKLNRLKQPNMFVRFWYWLIDIFRKLFHK